MGKYNFWGGVIVLLILVFGVGQAWGTVSFQMRSAQTQLGVGEELTVGIYAMIEGSVAGGTNGLVFWQMNVQLPESQNGVVEVKQMAVADVIKAPLPLDSLSSGWGSINAPTTGCVNLLAGGSMNFSSTTGLGDYSLVAELTLTGLSEGTVTYALGGPSYAFYGMDGDFQNHDGVFDAANSQTEFTIAPEPAGILLLLVGAGGWLRRKTLKK